MTHKLQRWQVEVVWISTMCLFTFSWAFWNTYTFVYAYHHFGSLDQAIFNIVRKSSLMVILILALLAAVRRVIIRHPWTVAAIGSIGDGMTELFLLKDPFLKFFCDALIGFFIEKVWKIEGAERKNSIWEESGARTRFDLVSDLCVAASSISASILATMVEMDIRVVIWCSAGSTVVTYYISTCRFVLADVYARQEKIVYPCFRKKIRRK